MDNYMGEIRLFAYSRVPKGWLPCNGQSMPINQYTALYALLGNQFGGDSKTYFNLPNLKYSAIMGRDPGNGYPTGKAEGAATVALTQANLPAHTHTMNASLDDADIPLPRPNSLPAVASGAARNIYGSATPAEPTSPLSIKYAGDSQAHNNIQPSLGLVYCIATSGLFPPRD